MLEQERQQIAQELINATAATLSVTTPDKAFPVMVRVLIEYGGWEFDRAERLAKQLIKIASMQAVVTQLNQ